MPDMPAQYFYDDLQLEGINQLEQHWQIIQAELNRIINQAAAAMPNSEQWLAAHPHYVQSEQGGVAWKTYEFAFFGIWQRTHCQTCPETYRLLQQIPQLVTAQYSLMEPHTHIKPHKGYTRMVLRGHLGLIVPCPDQVALRVGDQTRSWQEGKIMIFDDSYEHEAWNKSDKQRAVLMFDIANSAWGYTAEQICRYKLAHTADPFLLQIADNATWLKWYEQGYFPEIPPQNT
jgi:aspartyl/asparaginyl beta-hydroxylase (cupin superfamily)